MESQRTERSIVTATMISDLKLVIRTINKHVSNVNDDILPSYDFQTSSSPVLLSIVQPPKNVRADAILFSILIFIDRNGVKFLRKML